MPKNERLFAATTGSQEAWQNYANSLSRGELGEAAIEIERIAADLKDLLETVESNRDDLRFRIKQIDDNLEKDNRQQRRLSNKTSLRAFLADATIGQDVALKDLLLCTVTGASVRLEGLAFNISGEQREIITVNEAKRLFQEGHKCRADWRLYYTRDGARSAGFAWDKPFLDQVCVCSADTDK